MLAHALIHLCDRCFGGGHVAERVQQHKVVNCPIVPNCVDADARLFQLSGVGLALVAQGIVLRGNDKAINNLKNNAPELLA
jgi:hypothetical protein